MHEMCVCFQGFFICLQFGGTHNMAHQHKFISLAEFKASDRGAGTFEGYASRFGELDDVGDIVLPGAYKGTIAQFMSRGFTAQSHDWNVTGGVIGYPVKAQEDNTGLFIQQAFHSTQDAQDVRTKAMERMAAGLQVSLSIGYDTPQGVTVVYPSDYEKVLPQHIRPDILPQTMEKARQFKRVRLLSQVELYEVSIVSAPALVTAAVTAVKGLATARDGATPPASLAHTPLDIKGLFEDGLQERTNDPQFLFSVYCSALWQVAARQQQAVDTGTEYDHAGAIDEAVSEFASRLREASIAMLSGGASGNSMGMMYAGLQPRDVKAGLGDGLPYAAFLQLVVDANRKLAERTEERVKVREGKQAPERKEGRVLSGSNMQDITEIVDMHDEVGKRLRGVLERAKPKDKTDESKAVAEVQELLRQQQRNRARLRELQRS